MNGELLTIHLQMVVPLRIGEYFQQGGPSEEDLRRVYDEYPQYLGAHGDAVQFREKGTTTRAINTVVDGLAVLSFCPGGITAFGLHFETKMPVEERV